MSISRYFFLGISFSFVLFLAGCSTSQVEPTISEKKLDNFSNINIDESWITPNQVDLVAENRVLEKLSVITPEGKELELKDTTLFEKLQSKMSQLVPVSESIGPYIYTVLVQFNQEQTTVIQIGNKGIQMNGELYAGEFISEILDDIGNAIGNQIINDIEVNQLCLLLLDTTNSPIFFEPNKNEELIHILRGATYLQTPPDIKIPLFPHYVVQMMGENKSVLNIDIIGRNFIAIPYGKGKPLFFKVKENLYDEFMTLYPPFEYSIDHLGFLFNATSMDIEKGMDSQVQLGGEGIYSPQVNSMIDLFVRVLLEGVASDQKKPLKSNLTLTFHTNELKQKVELYKDGFYYNSQYYQLPNLETRIEKIMDEIYH